MAFTIKAKVLAELLNIAGKVVAKSTIPILECVRMDFADEGVEITTTDLDKWIKIRTEDYVGDVKATAIVVHKPFQAIVSALDGEKDVTLAMTKTLLTLKTDTSKYTFGLLKKEDMPEIPDMDKASKISMSKALFLRGLNFTSASIAHDETRYYLNGLHVTPMGKNAIRMESTNGHMASFFNAEIKGEIDPKKGSIIIPQQLVQCFNDIISKNHAGDDISVEISNSLIRIEAVDGISITVMGKMIDGTFPDMDRLLRYDRTNKVNVMPRAAVIEALKRINTVGRYSEKQNYGVKIEFNSDGIRITSKSADAEELVANSHPFTPVTVGANSSLLINLLSSFTKPEVDFLTGDDPSDLMLVTDMGTVIEPKNKNFAILMPMLVV